MISRLLCLSVFQFIAIFEICIDDVKTRSAYLILQFSK